VRFADGSRADRQLYNRRHCAEWEDMALRLLTCWARADTHYRAGSLRRYVPHPLRCHRALRSKRQAGGRRRTPYDGKKDAVPSWRLRRRRGCRVRQLRRSFLAA